MSQEAQTREEILAKKAFEWVKTERSGDVCKFDSLFTDDSTGITYVVFTDKTRVNEALIGDVVLAHDDESAILGVANAPEHSTPPVQHGSVEDLARSQGIPVDDGTGSPSRPPVAAVPVTPVTPETPSDSIIKKAKKKNEKLTLEITLKLPSPDMINVLRESFDNIDNALLSHALKQVEGKKIEQAVKASLTKIYKKK